MNQRSFRPSVLHVIVRAGATNSQYNEHCLPVLHERRITVASLFPADVTPPSELRMVEGDGSFRGSMKAIRSALALGPYDVVHVHAPVSGILTLLVYLFSRRSRRNLVFTVHNSWPNFRRRNRAFLYLILLLYPTVVLCGGAAYESLPRLLRWSSKERLSIIPNGVDLDRIDRAIGATLPAPRTDSLYTVVSVNRLIPLKDPWTVLEAFERLRDPDAELLFVGDGPLRDGLVAGSGVSTARDRVHFAGIIPRDDVYRLLRDADVFVSASGGEGLPVAVLEAMACGCPVVLSDIPPHREIAALLPGVPMVRVGDASGFARALRQVREYEPEERGQLVQQQSECVAEHFSVRAMNQAYRELYMQLIEPQRRPGRSPSENGQPPSDGSDVVGLLARMRARLGTCIALTLLGALAGFGYAQVQTPEYEAMTSLIVGDVIGGPADHDALDASAALASSYADLARREPVLRPVAEQGFADNWQQLQPRVHAQVGDKNVHLVEIDAVGPNADEAERLAEAVANRIVTMAHEQQTSRESSFVGGQLGRLEDQITATQKRIDKVERKLDAGKTTGKSGSLADELAQLEKALNQQQGDYSAMLQVTSGAVDGAKISILEHSYPAQHPLRPDLKALVAAGAGVGLALAAGVAYAAGRRRPARVDRRPGRGPSYLTDFANGHEVPTNGGRLFDDLITEDPTRHGGRS